MRYYVINIFLAFVRRGMDCMLIHSCKCEININKKLRVQAKEKIDD